VEIPQNLLLIPLLFHFIDTSSLWLSRMQCPNALPRIHPTTVAIVDATWLVGWLVVVDVQVIVLAKCQWLIWTRINNPITMRLKMVHNVHLATSVSEAIVQVAAVQCNGMADRYRISPMSSRPSSGQITSACHLLSAKVAGWYDEFSMT
jgi:hypothetical protein